MFTLVIAGRPNVGKSTLFNRLARKRLSIVNDQPGITRDWREAEGYLFDRTFRVIDTAGLEESFDDSIPARMRKQTEAALKEGDAVLFIVDGRAGITPMDKHFAGFLRKQGKPIILAVNKCEHEAGAIAGIAEAYKLGLGEPIAISAEHGLGMEDIYHRITPYYPEDLPETIENDSDGDVPVNIDDIEGMEDYVFAEEPETQENALKVAIVGRPNVGKSSLLNEIIGEHRSMTGPEAGITRDAVSVNWIYKDRRFRLVDTAGMRRKARVQDVIEKLSVEDSLRAIRLAHVVMLVIDGTQKLEKQDLLIAQHVIEEGRALILVVNKWDIVREKDKALSDLKDRMQISLAQIPDLPFVTISALNGRNIDTLLDKVLEVYACWNKRIGTSNLNRWLAGMESRNPAPMVQGRPNRLKYITQIKGRPPTFALWVSRAGDFPASYRRYIINGLRKDYDLPGVPIKLMIRASKNPFAD